MTASFPGSDTFMRKLKPQDKQDRLQSIDEDEQPGIDISEAGFNYESVKRWALTGKTYEPQPRSLSASKAALKAIAKPFTPPLANAKPPFQSESTLVGADALHRDEKTFKSRIQGLLYKPKEERKKLVKPEVRDKSPSLLVKIGKLGSKFGQLNPFGELAGKKSGSTEFKPASEQTLSEAKFVQRSKKTFEIKYTVMQELGAGGHSTVYLARNQFTNALVVCKFIKDTSVWKWYKDAEEGMTIPYEIHVMRVFNTERGPRAIEYIEHFHLGQGKFVIVMEYLGEDWCDLYEYIENYGPVREEHAREIFGGVVDAIQAMHTLGFLHNDIKGMLITRELKLIDFGSCTPLVPGRTATLFYGTKKFASPEAITQDSYDPSAQEVWALGALLYVILLKMDPFKTDEDILEADMQKKIQRLRMNGYKGLKISDEAVDAMLGMLEKNPMKRVGLEQISSMAFLK